MRIYEFAKSHDVDTHELIQLLGKQGFVVKSHMSVFPEEAMEKIKALLKKVPEQVSVAAVPEKKEIISKEQVVTTPPPSSAPQGVADATKRKNEMQKEPQKTFSRPSAPKSYGASSGRPSSQRRPQQRRGATPFVPRKQQPEPVAIEKKPFVVRALTVGEFAEENHLSIADLIVTLLKQGKMCTINYLLSEEQVKQLCHHYAIELEQKEEKVAAALEGMALRSISHEGERKKRLPVVVVMGHVDHGKTSLLDYIRKTRVAAREKGGITQHLGAYQVRTAEGELVFLDTPGHEAFSKIRKRGISVADLAVLVIAADDGVMPQTVECIKVIKSLQVPVVAAINKMDKVDAARIEIIKRQLAQYDMVPEEWGGNVICVPVSAKTGEGVDQLLEMLVFSAEMLELDAAHEGKAQGYVLEAKMAQGKGIVATIICHAGTLAVGDFFKVEEIVGKIVSITDSYGTSLKSVGASVPVVVTGFPEMPAVGGILEVISEADYKNLRFQKDPKAQQAGSLGSGTKENQVPLIVRADTFSSLEAILDGITKQFSSAQFKHPLIIRSGVGNVTESDALLAQATGAVIVGFSIKIENNAASLIRKEKVVSESFDIIYKLFERLEEVLAIQKVAKKEFRKIGEALVLKTFDVKKLGVIAGCVIKEGRFNENGTIVVMRSKKEIFKGKLKSLQRDKKNVKEVHTGFECAFIADGFDEWEEGDIVYCNLEVLV